MSQRRALPGAVRPGLGPMLPAGQRQAQDRALDHSQLLPEGTAVVGQAVALADVLHLWRDLRVAGAGQVREEVMLDLEAEVAAGDVEERASLDVRRAGQLAHVPTTRTLVLDLG